jgi:tRNA 2-selenouridine synthase
MTHSKPKDSMLQAIGTDQFEQLFLSDRPMFDVRAPVEFTKGAFPYATNLPLMVDHEREQVGLCYKQQGQEAAIVLGHELVNGPIKQERISQWLNFVTKNPDAVLYCFRGGLRSRISQQWLGEAGVKVAFVEGGYKALRHYLLERLEQLLDDLPMLVLSGRTGSGKTEILPLFDHFIDLEGIAKHRGSSFGKQIDDQPSQIDFENQIAIQLIKLNQGFSKAIVYEDESRLIGCRLLPLSLQAKLKSSKVMLLTDSFEARVDRIFEEYVVKAIAAWNVEKGDELEAYHAFSESLRQSMYRIRKRLGSESYTHLVNLLEEALKRQISLQDLSCHQDWIAYLLTRYYDPMYDYQLSLKQDRVVVQGNSSELAGWYQTTYG